MLDWNRIHELRNEVGDDEFKLILELFLDEVEGALMHLSKRNAGKLADDLHFLKGCAWNLGFRDFGKLCDEGERLVAVNTPAAFDIEAMMACYSTSKQAIIRELAAQEATLMPRHA